MKQFIRYLYEYQDGRPVRNVGFVKVEQTDAATVVHIHGKGLRLTDDRRLKIYIFYVTEGQCIGIWQGDIAYVNPAVNYRLSFTPEDTGRRSVYPLIDGVILENGGHRRFAAVWNDMPAAVEKMKVWKEEPEPDLVETVMADSPSSQEPEEQAETAPPEDEKEEEEEEPCAEEPDTGLNAGDPHYMKIRRKDIAQLKRCEWRLANNSFLLHGYYNYHHLLLIQEEDQCWLGVPGIYHPKEAQAAEAFGFPRFIRPDEEKLDLTEEEINEDEEFGYWCRPVRRP